MMKYRILVIAVLLIMQNAHCQQLLSLKAAIDTALKNSYDIAIVRNNKEIAGINNYIGIAGGLPTVTAGASDNEQLSTTNQKFANPANDLQRSNVGINTLTANITGTMLLYNGLRVKTTQKRLQILQQQNQELLQAQIQATVAAVMIKYFDVVRQQNYLNTIALSIETAKQRLQILHTRKEVGMANDADIFQSQIDLNALVQQQKSQELIILQAKADLLNLMYLPPVTNYQLTDSIQINQHVSLDSILHYIPNNPSIVAAEQQIDINKLIEKETSAQRYPSIRVNSGYNFSNNKAAAGFNLLTRTYGPFVSVNVSIPIYNGTIAKRQEKIAKINTTTSQLQKENLVLDYKTNAYKTFDAYNNNLQQLKMQSENYWLSNKLLKLVMQKFELGQATIVDVKQAQQSFENEGYRLINLTYNAKAAEIALLQMANKLVE